MIPDALSGPLLGRLGFRLMSAIGIVLMPLAVLSFSQAQKFEDEAQARWESSLYGETLLAAASEIDAINRSEGVAATLSRTILPVLEDTVACSAVMAKLVDAEANITFAGFIPPDGNMTCSSSDKPYSFAGDPLLADLVANPRPTVNVLKQGAITGESVIVFNHPVTGVDGILLGIISVSMPHRALAKPPFTLAQERMGEIAPLGLNTMDGDGNVLTSAMGMDGYEGRMPARPLADLLGAAPTTFTGNTRNGEPMTFAIVPVRSGKLYVLGSWSQKNGTGMLVTTAVPVWAFPVAMWVASLLAAWVAAEHQVLRHVRSLRRSIIAFAGGNRAVDAPDLDSAPNELRDVAYAYERMMSSVMHDEAKLEDALHQKEVLLREVHHRVKNNLQLIASIMNLQIRKAVNPEVRVLVKGLHDRVMSLATVHRELYQTSGLIDVRADELLQTIVAQVLRMGASSDRVLETETDFDPIRLTPDQAVPLSLIVTEAITNALKYAGRAASGAIHLKVSLHRADPARALLVVSNSMPVAGSDFAAPADLESTSLGQQLLGAFAMQLGGDLTLGPAEGQYVVRLDFPLRALSEGEDRHEAP